MQIQSREILTHAVPRHIGSTIQKYLTADSHLLGREVRGGRSEVSLHQQLMSAAAQPLPRLPRVPVEMVEDTSHYRLVLLGGRERASAHLITHSLIVRYTAKISKIRAKNSATLRKILCFKKEVKEPWFICDNILA